MPLRFVFAVHNHQPVGNFDNVFENAYRDGYAPFLELVEQYPEIPISLHTSGPLMEWLAARKPEYLDRLRRMVARGQVEILGGPFYEPILTMIPGCDRRGQIRTYTQFLEGLLHTRVRGMWIPERVWEQNLVSDIADAGIEYTVLDDYHFRQAGVEEEKLFGYFLSEDDGRLLRIFPGSEPMRYYIPFRNVEDSFAYFGEVASKNPDAVVVFADDGEKFGSWPETHKHCFHDGWLRRFFDALRGSLHWIKPCTFSQAVDQTTPAGKIFLPDSSYREMTEWALPSQRLLEYNQLQHDIKHDPHGPRIKKFLRGGYWRNFRVKYPEIEEMYSRMLQVSRRLQEAQASGQRSAELDQARTALYRAQCNCPWWHGTFGGLYLPHLRNAVFGNLIAAENLLLQLEGKSGGWIDVAVGDFNLDGGQELNVSSNRLAAYLKPHTGGSLYELDLRVIKHNLLATLSRRLEAYHEAILKRVQPGEMQSVQTQMVFKQEGLDRLIHYDAYLRKSLVDHFYEPNVTLAELSACQEAELGDFVTGSYEHEVKQDGPQVTLILRRQGQASGHSIRVTKEITFEADSDAIEIHYLLEGLPQGKPLRFAVEFNFAGMAAGADDRYFYRPGADRAGQLQTLQDLPDCERIGLVDEWLGLDASVSLSRAGGIWAFPVGTVSQSEGGFELVHQSTAVVPTWLVTGDSNARWDVTITLKLDVSRAESRLLEAAAR
ncbi:MAG: alpha-amylase/4-alpha-glucanotransferase domain-containing protein [Gemmataceae bacterium]